MGGQRATETGQCFGPLWLQASNDVSTHGGDMDGLVVSLAAELDDGDVPVHGS